MITDKLLFRFLNQETSNKENRVIKNWLATNPEQESRLDALRESWESGNQPGYSEEIMKEWNKLELKLVPGKSILRVQPVLSLKLARIAAVVLVLVGSAFFWFYHSNTHILRNMDLYTKSYFLPDGSQVDLGPGSKIVYNKEFLKGIREIKLTGEAYFDVKSDPGNSFTVIAGLARIRVLGTRFVVNASPRNEEVEVSVKSGNVLFYNSETMDKNSFRMGLVAGEMGIFYPAQNRMDKTRDPYFQPDR